MCSTRIVLTKHVIQAERLSLPRRISGPSDRNTVNTLYYIGDTLNGKWANSRLKGLIDGLYKGAEASQIEVE